MKIIDQFKYFNEWTEYNKLSPSAQLLWHKLLYIFNKNYWPQRLKLSSAHLKGMTNIVRNGTFYNARKELIDNGLIGFNSETDEYTYNEITKDEETGFKFGAQTPNTDVQVSVLPTTPERPKKSPKLPYNEIYEYWNNHCGDKPKITKMTDSRKRAVKKLVDKENYTIEEIKEVIKKSEDVPFLNGDNNRGWTMKFDWFIKPANFLKVKEDSYSSSSNGSKGDGIIRPDIPAITFEDDIYAEYR